MTAPAKERLLHEAARRRNPSATGDAPPDAALPLPPRRSRSVRDGAAALRELSARPRWSWGFPTLDQVAPVPLGSLVYLIGATGRGKSSFLLQVARAHAERLGPAIVLSAELSFTLACGRLASQVADTSWLGALHGELADDALAAALDVPRLRVLDDVGPSWPEDIENELAHAAREHPGAPILIAVDYLQLLRTRGSDPRERVSAASTTLREIAARTGSVILALSKASRTAARGLRAGDLVGVDATEAGAETNTIEQDAFVQLQLGAMRAAGPNAPAGCKVVDLSVSKARLGQPDVVIPFLFDGAHGWFREHGAPRSVAQHRLETAAPRDGEPSPRARDAARARVLDALATATEALSRNQIAALAGGRRAQNLAALSELVATGEVAEVVGRKTGGRWPLALLSRASTLSLRPARGSA